MKKLIFVFAVFILQSLHAQETDFFKIRKYKVRFLVNQLQETSGLNFFDGKLYTFNDSGNTAELFEIDRESGNVLNTLKINAQNKDWEALANDGENFFIGDFGNNSGTRLDLEIYKVPFRNGNIINDSIQVISFYYPEQNDFTPKNIRTDFDAEAMIYLNGQLHIFTKEWAAKSTSHYIVDPEMNKRQAATKVEYYPTGFVVTDASYFDKKLYLIGYNKKTEVFLNIFNETEPGIFFKEKPKHYYLGSAMTIGQIEGIAVDEKGLYISGEKFRHPLGTVKPSLYFVPKEQLKD